MYIQIIPKGKIAMLHREKGVMSGSEFFVNLPSALAKDMLFYVVECGSIYCNSNYHVKRKSCDSLLLCYIKSGCFKFGNSKQEFIAREGQIALIDGYKEHFYCVEQDTEFIWIHFDGHFARDFLLKLIERNGNSFPVDHTVYDEIYKIISVFRNIRFCAESEVSCMLYRVLCQMVIPFTETSSNMKEPVRQGAAYINENFTTIKSIDEVCRAIGISKFYFIRSFRKSMDISPYEYLIQRKITAARHLLKTTRLSIKEIAFQCGYASESGFIKAFIDKTGISPTEYRNFPI